MQCYRWMIAPAVLIAGLAGCSGSQDAPASQSAEQPAAQVAHVVVFDFLEAVRTGNDEKASALLTRKVRQETAKRDLVVAPPGSETASFEVGAVEYIGNEGAHVASTWTEIDEEGQPNPTNFLWVLRLESGSWRIAGVIYKVFEDAPPLILNFEDPDDMERKQELLSQELMRRAQAQQQQARQPAGESQAR